jgi:RsiW-degrading membrane proteinase PrsW (M82 family)
MLLSLTLIIAMSVLYLALMRTLDTHTSVSRIAGALLWGGVSFGLALVVQNGLADRNLLDERSLHLFSAPVLEELLKALPLLFIVRLTNRRPGAICGFAIGLGFALAESALYITGSPDHALGAALARIISIHLIHGFTTALIGLTISRSAGLRAFSPALAAAMLTHAAFNWMALSLDGSLLVIAAAYAGLSSAALLVLLLSRRTTALRIGTN